MSTQADPPSRTSLAAASMLRLLPLPQAMRRRIVFVGTVNQRNLSSVTAWLQKETSDNEAKWGVVSVGKQEDIQKLQRSSGAKFSVVWDADGKWHRQWNAVLLPRVYEVDAAWRLKAIIRPSGGCAEGCGGCGGGPT